MKGSTLLKNIIALIAISLLAILSPHIIHPIITALLSCHDWVSELLLQVFSGGQAGSIARNLIALLAMPLIISVIPAIVYWLAKRSMFPYFMHTLWAVWLVQTTALIVLNK
ncbi:MAG TPA: hypothetical protein VHA13_02170 [Gammaproteobacteria bacterium]|nr:hypothetical protein [Gammaproteobacteria bacterium]